MKALELLREYQYADDCLGGMMAESLLKAIKELEELIADNKKLNDDWVDCVDRYESLAMKQNGRMNK